MPDTPVTPLPASTVLLLRDGKAGLEVFMVKRPTKMDFAAGALVYPGGKVDPADKTDWLRDRSGPIGEIDDFHLSLHVAAVRETFEECGVLLARPTGSAEMIPAERVPELDEKYRGPLMKDEIGIDEMIEAENLDLACDLLVYYAHWITPEMRPKRFDTHFFLAPTPPGQVALHDGRESLDSLWNSPQGVIDDYVGGIHFVMFPTYCTLMRLDRSNTVDEALDRARGEKVVTVLGQRAKAPDGTTCMVLPKDAGYDIFEVPDPKAPNGKHLVIHK